MISSATKVFIDRLVWTNSSSIVKLKKSLVVTSKYSGEEIKLYEEEDGWLGIPLHHFPILKLRDKIEDRRTDGVGIPNMKFTSGYRSGQEEVINKFTVQYATGRTGFVIKAPTGWGKTCVCIKLAAIVNHTTLVIVPRANLVDQWIERLLEHSNLKRKDIGVISGGKANYQGKKIVIGLVHSLILDRIRFDSDLANYFGTIIFDEVDRSVPPETFSTAASLFPARIRIGVSATVKRQDGLEVIFEKHIGECYIEGKKPEILKPKIIIQDFGMDSGYVHPQSPKINRRGMLLSRLEKNITRNFQLCKYVKLMHESGRQCLVISDRVKQLQMMYDVLFNEFEIPKKDMGYYVGSLYADIDSDKKIQVKEEERKRVAKECKVILATYGKVSIGTDIDTLSGLVLATPTSDVLQTVGRIVRIMEGKLTPIVVDFVDSWYKDARGWAYKRKKFYQENNFYIKEVS